MKHLRVRRYVYVQGWFKTFSNLDSVPASLLQLQHFPGIDSQLLTTSCSTVPCRPPLRLLTTDHPTLEELWTARLLHLHASQGGYQTNRDYCTNKGTLAELCAAGC